MTESGGGGGGGREGDGGRFEGRRRGKKSKRPSNLSLWLLVTHPTPASDDC